jgi:two-component system, OmpR family, phosphate regulon response regulator PhoB
VAKRILIVDGDADSRLVYRIMLEHRGYDVDVVEDGESALQYVRQQPVDAVVTELTLRLVDGHTLLERLRADERTRDLCVVVLTARALDRDRARAEQAQCARFLVKPLEPNRLVREMEALIGL